MTTITKERLLTIKQWRETYGPGSNVVLPAEEAEELARIALAQLEAKPIGAFHIAEQQVDGTSDYIKDGEWPIDNGTIEVYAAPPVPVVPAALPENDDEDGHDIDCLEPSEVYALGRTAGWNACRAAMLQGGNHTEQHLEMVDHSDDANKMVAGNSPVIPNGWKLVPIDPTKDMLRAGQSVVGFWLNTVHCYSKMLAAAPAAPQQEAKNV